MTAPVAILGATSQLARDFAARARRGDSRRYTLFARSPKALRGFVDDAPADRFSVADLESFDTSDVSAIMNFIGVGDPSRAQRMGSTILEVTEHWDTRVLAYIRRRPETRYVFLSSGAVYGQAFQQPVDAESTARIPINALRGEDLYGIAKLRAELSHRLAADLSIIDVRIFNYVSDTSDIEARFLITEAFRAIRDNAEFATGSGVLVRDFLHPDDLYALLRACLDAPADTNGAIDAYSAAPCDRDEILSLLTQRWGLRTVCAASVGVNATGPKAHYYSRNRAAEALGYRPRYRSLEAIEAASEALLGAATAGAV